MLDKVKPQIRIVLHIIHYFLSPNVNLAINLSEDIHAIVITKATAGSLVGREPQPWDSVQVHLALINPPKDVQGIFN